MLDLSARDLDRVCAILHQHARGLRVLAYGSRVQGKARPTSDLDLALDAPAPVPLPVMGALQEALKESDLPFRVDVVDLASVTPDFQALIRSQAVEIAGAAELRGRAAER